MEKIKDEYKDIVKKEGNYEAFTHNGFKCRVIRFSGHWNGYVGVPKSHWAYGMNYNYWDNEESKNFKKSFQKKVERINSIEVHGGLTYSSDSLNMQPETDLRWFGFDTAHYLDLQIIDYGYSSFIDDGIYRDKEYVINETKSLAEQLTAPLKTNQPITS